MSDPEGRPFSGCPSHREAERGAAQMHAVRWLVMDVRGMNSSYPEERRGAANSHRYQTIHRLSLPSSNALRLPRLDHAVYKASTVPERQANVEVGVARNLPS